MLGDRNEHACLENSGRGRFFARTAGRAGRFSLGARQFGSLGAAAASPGAGLVGCRSLGVADGE